MLGIKFREVKKYRNFMDLFSRLEHLAKFRAISFPESELLNIFVGLIIAIMTFF